MHGEHGVDGLHVHRAPLRADEAVVVLDDGQPARLPTPERLLPAHALLRGVEPPELLGRAHQRRGEAHAEHRARLAQHATAAEEPEQL
jgi:hypothetical protein